MRSGCRSFLKLSRRRSRHEGGTGHERLDRGTLPPNRVPGSIAQTRRSAQFALVVSESTRGP